MIVDYIENGQDQDLEGWKKSGTGGNKKHQITAWTPSKAGVNIQSKMYVPVPNCQLDDLIPYIINPEKRLLFDGETISHVDIKREYPLDT